MFRPGTADPHDIMVRYNNELTPGSPHQCIIMDAGQAPSRTGGLGAVPVGMPTTFWVDPGNFGSAKCDITVTSPSGLNVPCGFTGSRDKLVIQYTPEEVGSHSISIMADGVSLPGSPFATNVYDPTRVTVDVPSYGRVGQEVTCTVMTTYAGEGDVEAEVSSGDGTTPCDVYRQGEDKFLVTFTPKSMSPHDVVVKFNGSLVPGNPFRCVVTFVDVSKVTVSGDGIEDHRPLPVGKPTSFFVNTDDAGVAMLQVDVTGPGFDDVEAAVSPQDDFHIVEYTPVDVGEHRIKITYDGKEIEGSPFKTWAYDVSKINVLLGGDKKAKLNEKMSFLVDTSHAGGGKLECIIRDPPTETQMMDRGLGRYLVSFLPVTPQPHGVTLSFNRVVVPGSPFKIQVVDARRATASGDGLQLAPINTEAVFVVDTARAGGASAKDIEARVTSPSRASVPCKVRDSGVGDFTCHFTPTEIGPHIIVVTVLRESIDGSPFTCQTFDLSKVKVGPVQDTTVGQEMSFWIQTAAVGKGTPTVEINCAGRTFPCHVKGPPGGTKHNCHFQPKVAGSHEAVVRFNGFDVEGSPFAFQVRPGQSYNTTIEVQSPTIYPQDDAVLPNRPKSLQMRPPDHPPLGRRQSEPVSPTRYEPNSPTRNEPNSPRRPPQPLSPRRAEPIAALYAARSPGPRTPPSPGGFTIPEPDYWRDQDIQPKEKIAAYGQGLKRAVEGKISEFVVDTTGHPRASLEIQVFGPSTMIPCTVDRRGDKHYASYTPRQVGAYKIHAKYGGHEIEGSPFQVTVVNPKKVELLGDWRALMGNTNRLSLTVDEQFTFPFNVQDAGPGGILDAIVQGPSRDIRAKTVQKNNGRQYVTFIPKEEGEHFIQLRWLDFELPCSPIYGDARGFRSDPNKVVVSGSGIREAFVNEVAEFVLDGSDAGPGEPMCVLRGREEEVEVTLMPFPQKRDKYRALYCAEKQGTYRLKVTWDDAEVRGSPFKITVKKTIDVSRVRFSGITGAVLGSTIRANIDPRDAGAGGLLQARCLGPNGKADVQLTEKDDGIYLMKIRAKEAGKHELDIKYNGEKIEGSPFIVDIAPVPTSSGGPDAKKVTAFGPGLKHGVLSAWRGNFLVHTAGAGPGKLQIKVDGPKPGSFKLESRPLPDKDRAVAVNFTPKMVGKYVIAIKWSDENINESPFEVIVFGSSDEAKSYDKSRQRRRSTRSIFDKSR
ncbi:filamin-B-like [Branchiostoma floridae x Branchiostoma belcheri]